MDKFYEEQYKKQYLKFILLNIDLGWNYHCLSKNAIMPANNIFTEKYKNNKRSIFYYNPYYTDFFIDNTLSINNVIKHPYRNWSWEYICANPNLDWKTIQKYPDIFTNWRGISYNTNISYEMVKNNMHLPWNWNILSRNKMKNALSNYIIRETNVFIYLILYKIGFLNELILYILTYIH